MELADEVTREAVGSKDVVFLDADGEETPVSSPRLKVRAAFEAQERVRTLRECGLFGGDATEAPGSGFMIDYVIHPRIDL